MLWNYVMMQENRVSKRVKLNIKAHFASGFPLREFAREIEGEVLS